MCKRSVDEFYFPKLIIQHIQSFLTSKEAAQTTILSKSWQSAWLTRPNLDFDHADFCGYDHVDEDGYDHDHVDEVDPKFLEFAEKLLERYENSNLNIESFSLRIRFIYIDNKVDTSVSGPAVKKLLCRALKLGPTRVALELDGYDFEIPDEVFRYDNLLSLTAEGCKIFNLNRDAVCCSRLQFLRFQNVEIKGGLDTMFHIISSCPLIEKLSLCHVYVNGPYGPDYGSLHTIISPLSRLKSLVLEYVRFDSTFLADLSSIFPSLKDLTLNLWAKELIISSPTLESLHFDMMSYNGVRRVKFDVPNIRKLTFEYSSIPDELSVQSNSREWESRVFVKLSNCLNASWFYKLGNFLKELRHSRISLSLHVDSQDTFDYEGGDIRGFPTTEIENLNIYHDHLPTISCYALFDGLFRICHPKVITQYTSTVTEIRYSHSYDSRPTETKNFNFLVKRFLEARDANVPIANYQFMYALNDLKEARAQVFDRAVSAWRDVKLESLLDYESTQAKDSPVCRFQLNWKQ